MLTGSKGFRSILLLWAFCALIARTAHTTQAQIQPETSSVTTTVTPTQTLEKIATQEARMESEATPSAKTQITPSATLTPISETPSPTPTSSATSLSDDGEVLGATSLDSIAIATQSAKINASSSQIVVPEGLELSRIPVTDEAKNKLTTIVLGDISQLAVLQAESTGETNYQIIAEGPEFGAQYPTAEFQNNYFWLSADGNSFNSFSGVTGAKNSTTVDSTGITPLNFYAVSGEKMRAVYDGTEIRIESIQKILQMLKLLDSI